MIHLHKNVYPYLDEVDSSVLRHFSRSTAKPEKEKVLDIGCGGGKLGEAIEAKGYEVWGIEENTTAAAIAQKRITKVFIHGLEAPELEKSGITKQKFEYLVFSDVLEHLYDPFQDLCRFLPLLSPGGKVYVSVPNALVWVNRLAFLFGRFRYTETGVMDRTHIRFFTFKTAKELLIAAGLEIQKVDYTPYIVRVFLPLIKKVMKKRVNPGRGDIDRKQIIEAPAYKVYKQYVYPLEYFLFSWWKSLFAFRIILIGTKND